MLTDLVMPGMSGVVLAEKVRVLVPDIRVLYVSGYPRDTLVSHVMTASSFLPKPYQAADLSRCVRALLDSPAQG